VLRGRGLRRSNLLELGDLAGFDADLAAAEQTAQELRQLHYHWQLPLARATRVLLAGRFAEAEKQAVQGLAIGQRAGDQAVEIYYAGPVATLRFMQGRFGETVELFQDLAIRFPAFPVSRTALAAALAEAGRPVEARAEVERLAAGDLTPVPRNAAWSLGLALLAYACHHLGDAGLAAELHGLLEPYADRNIATGRFGGLCLGPAAYFLNASWEFMLHG
jgi:predicted Zn-dependent protease